MAIVFISYLSVILVISGSIYLALKFHKSWYAPLKELAIKPEFGGINIFLGAMVGYLGSHFDKEIYNATGRLYLPASWTGGIPRIEGQFTIAPVFFWILVIFTVIAFIATVSAQGSAAAEINAEFRSSLNRLFTMPPNGFLDEYRKLALGSGRLVMDLPPTLRRRQHQELIRTLLLSICNVVKEYDGGRNSCVYGCNIMLYFGTGSSRFNARRKALRKNIRCIERGVALENLAGVLELQRILSISCHTGVNPDTRLQKLALPIPMTSGPLDVLDYIPGAPLTFATGKPAAYRSQKDLIEKVEKNRRFSSNVLDDLIATLNAQNESVQAVICIPLYSYYTSGVPEAIGILNIHKNIIDEHFEAKYRNFGDLLAPLVQNLERAVSLYP